MMSQETETMRRKDKALRKRTIRLKKGETRRFLCGYVPRSQLHVIIHTGDSLIVMCRETKEVVTFRCDGGSGRRHFLLIPKNTRVIVTCRR